MAKDVRRALGVQPPRRRRAWPAVVAAALIVAVAVAIGLSVDGEDGADRPPPAAPAGVIDRELYRMVSTGSSKSRVRRVLGGGPRRVERSPLLRRGPECWVYGRRSGAEGVYRFCFRGDLLEAKYLA
ncbi:hypothetical protein [Miltoncostaea marina]|uniref:hypothetical protein n=1 Tax=Miltoncostaea marina TaxID=2843215 RepID=UPI001C3CFBEE|nr:hypothetical protein [Miltoncostaea marina]